MVLRLFFLAFLLLLGCGDLEFNNPTDPYSISHPGGISYKSFTDKRDGKTYNSVEIGTQTWMAENLNYAAEGSYCIGNVEYKDSEGKTAIKDTLVSDGGYCEIYGRFYDWNTAKSVCPSGWHLPTRVEWQKLIDFASGTYTKLMSRSGWKDGNGTDDYGFTALPGSYSTGYWSFTGYLMISGYGGWGSGGSGPFNVRCLKGDIPYNTVTFNANGATSGSVPANISVVSGENAQIPGNGSLQKTGYIFNGWNVNNSGTGANYKAGSSYDVTNDIILYANWVLTRTVTFDGNNATSGTAPQNITAGNGFTIELPQQGTLVKTGYLFVGWNSSNSGTGTNYNAGSTYTVADDITLYAAWGIPCTITFVATGASSVPQNITAGSGATIQLPPAVSKSGYNFGGWNSRNTGTDYSASSSYTVAGNDTLSAVWTVQPVQTGSVKITSTNKSYALTVTLTSSSSTKTYSTSVGIGGTSTITGVVYGTYSVKTTYYSNGTQYVNNNGTVTVNSSSVSISVK